MDNISHEIALIVCKQTTRLENERDKDFSKRLYSIYQSCKNTIDGVIEQENTDSSNASSKATLSMMNH